MMYDAALINVPDLTCKAGRQHLHSPPPMHLGGHYNPYGLHTGAGFMGNGMDPRNAPVTVRLLVPLAAGMYFNLS